MWRPIPPQSCAPSQATSWTKGILSLSHPLILQCGPDVNLTRELGVPYHPILNQRSAALGIERPTVPVVLLSDWTDTCKHEQCIDSHKAEACTLAGSTTAKEQRIGRNQIMLNACDPLPQSRRLRSEHDARCVKCATNNTFYTPHTHCKTPNNHSSSDTAATKQVSANTC